MIKIKEYNALKAIIDSGMKTAFEDVKTVYKDGQKILYFGRKPTLSEQYLIDMTYLEKHLEIDRYSRPVHPDEAEGYDDIDELKEYVTIVSRFDPWYICKTPACVKDKISSSIGQGQWTF